MALVKFIKKNYLALTVVVFGIIGVWAAFTLTINKLEYYKNPNFIPSCSINPWLDCGAVMKSKWSSLFGFPNMLIGLITYPLAIFSGLTMILNQKNHSLLVKIWLLISGLGVIMNLALLYASAYLIRSLCPWCLLAGVATSNIFLAILEYAVNNSHISLGKKINSLVRANWMPVFVFLYYSAIFSFVWLAFYLQSLGVSTDKFWDFAFWIKN
jgi:uncharacterized membrane protein